MPEDYERLSEGDSVLSENFLISWQEIGDYVDYLSDMDLFCTYLCISI